MPVYVDEIRLTPSPGYFIPKHKWKWNHSCHMVADTLEELHSMADKIGLKRAWFQKRNIVWRCHYDLTISKRKLAVKNGALEITAQEWYRKLKEICKNKTIKSYGKRG